MMCNQCFPAVIQANSIEGITENHFAEKVLGILNSGAAALMLSIGHRTGLFDTMAQLPSSSSKTIAGAARLNERYVREWLGAMATSGIVLYNATDGTYHLPEAHGKVLTRAYPADNMATISQYIGLLGSVEDKVVDCFHRGGGVPYSEYPRFQTVMADDSGQSVLSSLMDHILPLVPGIKSRLEAGIDVLDVGCGKGKALFEMASHYPNSRFTGYDISEEGISSGNQEAQAKELQNIRFIQQDAAAFTEENVYDFITTFDAIHDQAKPFKVLSNIQRALKPDGYYLMQDIDMHTNVGENLDNPIGTFLYTVSCMHCMTVSLAEGGDGLGAAWGVELAQQMLRDAGFRSVEIKRLSHDIQNCYFIIRK